MATDQVLSTSASSVLYLIVSTASAMATATTTETTTTTTEATSTTTFSTTSTSHKTTTTTPPSDENVEINPFFSLIGLAICVSLIFFLCFAALTARHFSGTRSWQGFRVLLVSYLRCQCLKEECCGDGDDPGEEQATSPDSSSSTAWDPPPYRQALRMQRLDSTTIVGEPPPLYSSLDLKPTKSEGEIADGDFCFVNLAMASDSPPDLDPVTGVRNKAVFSLQHQNSVDSILQDLQYPHFTMGDAECGTATARNAASDAANLSHDDVISETSSYDIIRPDMSSVLSGRSRASPAHVHSLVFVTEQLHRMRMREPPSRMASVEESHEEQLPAYDEVDGDIVSRM